MVVEAKLSRLNIYSNSSVEIHREQNKVMEILNRKVPPFRRKCWNTLPL